MSFFGPASLFKISKINRTEGFLFFRFEGSRDICTSVPINSSFKSRLRMKSRILVLILEKGECFVSSFEFHPSRFRFEKSLDTTKKFFGQEFVQSSGETRNSVACSISDNADSASSTRVYLRNYIAHIHQTRGNSSSFLFLSSPLPCLLALIEISSPLSISKIH